MLLDLKYQFQRRILFCIATRILYKKSNFNIEWLKTIIDDFLHAPHCGNSVIRYLCFSKFQKFIYGVFTFFLLRMGLAIQNKPRSALFEDSTSPLQHHVMTRSPSFNSCEENATPELEPNFC